MKYIPFFFFERQLFFLKGSNIFIFGSLFGSDFIKHDISSSLGPKCKGEIKAVIDLFNDPFTRSLHQNTIQL
jgi:hypothetical protein